MARFLPSLPFGRRARARTLFNDATLCCRTGQPERAGELLAIALPLWRELNDVRMEGATLNLIAEVSRQLGRFEEALIGFQRALEIRRACNDDRGLAISLVGLALTTWTLSLGDKARLNEARSHYDEALGIAQLLGDPQLQGNVLSSVAGMLCEAGELEEAERHANDALILRRQCGDLRGEGVTLSALAQVQLAKGALSDALQNSEASISILTDVGDQHSAGFAHKLRAEILRSTGRHGDAEVELAHAREVALEIGAGGLDLSLDISRAQAFATQGRLAEAQQLYSSGVKRSVDLGLVNIQNEMVRGVAEAARLGGQGEEALEHYSVYLATARRNRDLPAEITALQGQGMAYRALGRYADATQCHETALRLLARRKGQDREWEAALRVGLGLDAYAAGRLQDAITQFEMVLNSPDPSVRDDPYAQGGLGLALRLLGQPDRAMIMFERARDGLARKGDRRAEASALSNIAAVQLMDWNDWAAARDSLDKVKTLQEDLGDRHGLGITLNNLGYCEWRTGNWEAADELYARSLELTGLTGDAGMQARGWLNRALLNEDRGQIAEASSHAALALDGAIATGDRVNQERANTTLGRLSARLGDFTRSDRHYEDALACVEATRAEVSRDEMRDSYFATSQDPFVEYVASLARRGESASAFNVAERARARTFLDLLERSREHPKRDEFVRAWDLSRVQSELLDDSTAILEYILDERQSFLIVATTGECRSFAIPPAGEIDRMVEDLLAAVELALPSYPHGAELYDALIRPAEPMLGNKKLIVVPDGALHYLPFYLLLTATPAPGRGGPAPRSVPRTAARGSVERNERVERLIADAFVQEAFDWKTLPYLGKRNTVTYAPSASVAGVMQQRRQPGSKRAMQLIAFGDPLFPAPLFSDDRFTRNGDLPFSRIEVESIARRTGVHAGDSPLPAIERSERAIIYLGGAATKQAVREVTRDAECRFFHVATHGYLDPDKPEASGLVFSRTALDDDAVWTVDEILESHISCDLVVLSACQTGRGRVLRGEGVIGLTRAFAYAGAASVCTSLWNVSDESTALLMSEFYHLLKGATDKGRALTEAQEATMADDRFSHPFFWAPFVLVGAS